MPFKGPNPLIHSQNRRAFQLLLIFFTILGFQLLISCKKEEIKEPQIISISVKTPPLKTAYFTHEPLDVTGIVIQIHTDDGKSEDIALADFETYAISLNPENGSLLDTTTDLRITHQPSRKFVNLLITVNEIEITDFTIKRAPNKLEYYIGEDIDLNGLVLSFHRNNQTTEEISFNDFENKGILCSPENGSMYESSTLSISIHHSPSAFVVNQDLHAITLTDIDENVYPIVKIYDRLWMGVNLKTTRYSNGDLIPPTDPYGQYVCIEEEPKYQWIYNGDEGNLEDYGRLYTWYVVTDSRNVCPDGWHVPSESEWIRLSDQLGGLLLSGAKLKERGTAHWDASNNGGTNQTGFTALPGGYRQCDGLNNCQGTNANFWSSSEYIDWQERDYGYKRYLYYGSSYFYESHTENKANGNSVRCLKD